ncbi:DUF4365 domain-containing protein [Sinomonas sp. G460-2]|uniref:DUF4365 domain-containing protein n=1 Tax=Sinomonas sp. G460-2 TaxID=3393464 RepID=UPI0039EE1FFF
MRQPDTIQLGELGEAAVSVFFQELGWGPVSTGKQDLGTDLYVQLRDEQQFDLRLLLGVQVKTGDGWFDRPDTVAGRPGWWYSESDKDHAEYWSNHHVPHILVLQSADRVTTRVWASLTDKTIVDTGKGIKVFVPADQRLDPSHADEWISLAGKARESIQFEGSRWSFSVEELPESAWARHALMAPRLIAPHPNKGPASPIVWAEAVAMCIEAVPHRWEEFSARFEQVPTVLEAESSEHPGWRFASAIHEWVTKGTHNGLRDLDLEESPRSLRVARAVCLSSAEFDDLRYEAALQALEAASDDEEMSVDQAWLNIHRARILAETGDAASALSLLQRTNSVIASVATDVTVTAVRSALIWSIFELTDRFDTDLSTVLPAMDTATGWWRNQAMASGLRDAAERTFEAWGRDSSVRFGDGNTAHNELFSASLTARLAGDHASWRSAIGLLAMVDLCSDRPGLSVKDSLGVLRQAGGESQLRLAIARVRDDGPLADLAGAMASVSREAITRTTWRADLAALTLAGGYCPPENARKLISFLLDGLKAPGPLALQMGEVEPRKRMLEALWGLRDHFAAEDGREVINFALSLGPDASQLMDPALGPLLRAIDQGVLAEHEADFAARAKDESLPLWLRTIFAAHAPTARAVLTQALLGGDVRALPAIGTLTALTPGEAAALTNTCANTFAGYKRSHNGISDALYDMGKLCAGLAIHFPQSGAWDVLIDFLCDSEAYASPKRLGCKVLAANSAKIPSEYRERLQAALWSAITDARPEPPVFFWSGIGGAFHELLLELLPPEHAGREALEAALLSGDQSARCDASDYYSRRPGSGPILLALAHDSDRQVAHQAIFGLARRTASSDGREDAFFEALASRASTEGEGNALHLLAGLEADEIPSRLIGIVSDLTGHPSASVRRKARRLLHLDSSSAQT